ncbi:hypothetical protein ScalyP_jg241, partial [Parmales sp. scaly parma]
MNSSSSSLSSHQTINREPQYLLDLVARYDLNSITQHDLDQFTHFSQPNKFFLTVFLTRWRNQSTSERLHTLQLGFNAVREQARYHKHVQAVALLKEYEGLSLKTLERTKPGERSDDHLENISRWFKSFKIKSTTKYEEAAPVAVKTKLKTNEHLSEIQLTTISQHLEIMFLERNSAVFMQGSKGDYYYILVEGKIHLHSAVSASQEFKARERIKKDPDILQLMTQSKIEEFCGKHNFSISKKYSGFGELALLHSTLAASDSERSLTALIGSSTAILVKLPKEHFDTALKSQHAEKMDLVLKVSFLKNFGVFKDWRTSSLIQLAYLMNIQKSSFGDKITLIDSPLNSVFFVLEGEVNLIRKVKIPRVSKEDKVTYKTHEIGGAGPSSILGDFETIMCGANNCRYKTTSVVKSAFCTTLVFSVNHFEDLVLNGHDEETANTVKANCRALERFRSDRVENYVNKELSAMVQKNAEKKMHGIMEAK